MSGEAVCTFELFGNQFQITQEFNAYNSIRSQQNREFYSIYGRYTDSINSMKEDLSRLTQKALNALSSVVAQINTQIEVGTVGFEELKRCQSEVLPRIGKRLLFKYSENELITIDEVAKHIRLDAKQHFSGFLNEVQKIEDKQISDWVEKEYARMTRSTPAVGGSIGTGMSALAGVMTANVGMSLLQGVGDRIAKALDESENKSATKSTVVSGQKAVYAAFYDMSNQMISYCINTLTNEMDAELAKIIMKPFKEVDKERKKEIKSKSENYHTAYQNGDMTPECYTAHLISVLHDFPYEVSLYYALYQAALDTGSSGDQAAVLDMAQYMGLEEQMNRWMKIQGIILQDLPIESASKEENTRGVGVEEPPNQISALSGQYAGTVHCMWNIKEPNEERVAGLRSDGSIWVTGDTEKWNSWRDIISVCSIYGGKYLFGLKTDGTIMPSHKIREDSDFYQSIMNWRDIIAISGGYTHLIGLRRDNSVVAASINNKYGQCNVDDWKNIVAIAAGSFHSVGLKEDGKVVAVGGNFNGQCNVSGWHDIVAISSANLTMGLTKAGQVILSDKDNPDGMIYSSVKKVIAISIGNAHALHLYEDGTVSASGKNDCGQCNVSEWENIVAVAAGDQYSIGVKPNGTLVTAGKNQFGECDVRGKVVGSYSLKAAQALKKADDQSIAWKATGVCPFCGGKISLVFKKCKSCKRSIE